MADRPALAEVPRSGRTGATRRRSGLVVGAAGDALEAAADRAARDAVAGWGGEAGLTLRGGSGGGRGSGLIRRAAATEADTAGGAIGREGGELDPATADDIRAARRGGGTPLEPGARRHMEQAFGTDFSRVRLHGDRRADELCGDVRAHAFTVGPDIFFRSGRPDTSSAEGRHLLAHELAHVAQGAGPTVIRRSYFDGERDWKRDTRVMNTTLDMPKRRSPRLEAVDAAVQAVVSHYQRGEIAELAPALTRLQTAIASWEAKRRPGRARVRGAQFARLEQDRDDLQRDVDYWLHAGFAAVKEKMIDYRLDAKRWLLAGADQTQDIRLRNSCRWVIDRRVKLFVVIRTADSRYRAELFAKTRGEKRAPEDVAYFPNPNTPAALGAGGAGSLYGPMLAYDETRADDPGVVSEKAKSGWNRPGRYIAVTEDGMETATVRNKWAFYEVLRHEVQHDADKHRDKELSRPIREAGRQGERDFETIVREYRTEYRAHFYQGNRAIDDAGHDPVRPSDDAYGLKWTPRQLHIYERIKREYPDLREAMKLGKFRATVNRYRDPDTEGFNKYNSPAIDDLYQALDAIDAPSGDPDDPKVKRVLDIVAGLDHHHQRYIFRRSESRQLNEKIEACLVDEALARLHRIVDPYRPQAPRKKKEL